MASISPPSTTPQAHHLAETELLLEFSGQLARAHKLRQLQELVRQAARRINRDTDLACICLFEEVRERLRGACHPGDAQPVSTCCFFAELAKRAVATAAPICIDDASPAPAAGLGDAVPYRALVAAPLSTGARALGALIMASTKPGTFDTADQRIWAALAGQVAVAVENVQLYDELRRAKRHVDAIIEHMADGLIVLDRGHRVVSVNPAAEEMLGLRAAEVAGWSPASGASDPRFEPLLRICQPHLPDTECLRHPALLDAEEPAAPPEVVVDTPQPRVLRVLSSPIEDADEGEIGEIRLLHDVTREHELEQMQRDFISTVSHELRTPLFSIKGFVELILKGKVPDPQVQREFLGRVIDQANHLSAIVSDLLDTSRLESGSMELSRTMLNLAEVASEVVRRLESVASDRDVTIEFQAAPGLPPVSGDARRLAQVVTNLVGNAIKFSPPGGTVQVRCQAQAGEVTLSVADQGPGIPPEAIPRLFSKFYQVDSSATRRAGGTGLGLYISRRIIEAHGGRIAVESQLGRGSVFWFSIPLQAKEG